MSSIPRARRSFAILPCLALIAAGCGAKKSSDVAVATAEVERRDIIVNAEATGSVEPVNVVEVKSKASGPITAMPVDVGSVVRRGDLLVQIDTRDVRNQWDQAVAALRAAQAKQDVSSAQKRRNDELFAQQAITAQEHETATLDFANAQASLVKARTDADLARQRLEDATVRAPVGGTVIAKPVSLGQVITSATSSASGGTTILNMADLSKVRMRALVNETDIGQVHPAQHATVTVDAFPNRRFRGVVEKIEPQAIVQQSVTMFPVLISLDNSEGVLMPGMNGQVSMLVSERLDVIAIPSDAVRTMRELPAAAQALGLNVDTVRAQMFAAAGARRGTAGGTAGGDIVPASRVGRDGRLRADSTGAERGARRRRFGGEGGVAAAVAARWPVVGGAARQSCSSRTVLADSSRAPSGSARRTTTTRK